MLDGATAFVGARLAGDPGNAVGQAGRHRGQASLLQERACRGPDLLYDGALQEWVADFVLPMTTGANPA